MILVEVLEATLKLTGAWEGTVKNQSLFVLVMCKQQMHQFLLNTLDLQLSLLIFQKLRILSLLPMQIFSLNLSPTSFTFKT